MIYGGDDNDEIEGGAGNDEIYGDAGIDTAVYSGNSSNYTITYHLLDGTGTTYTESNYVKVVGTEGTDKLYAIEKIQFADELVVLN